MSATHIRNVGLMGAVVDVCVSAKKHEPQTAVFDSVATLSVTQGAFHLQAYLTPADCESLAAALLKHADEVRALITEQAMAA